MKFALAACVCVSVVLAQTPITPETAVRHLPADVLRDFPGACFASTACRVFQEGESWPLSPFCGLATCVRNGTGLYEVVEDCGRRPKNSPGCNVTNADSFELPFPGCCPSYVCEPGKTLLYPTEAELQALAKAQAENASAARGAAGGAGAGAAP